MLKVFTHESFKALGKTFAPPRIGDAGYDLFSTQTITAKPNQRVLIPSGLSFEIPLGYVGLILDRSSIATKLGLHTVGGVIDSSYRGEIVIGLHNLSNNAVMISSGDKIAQMVIVPHLALDVVIVGDITELSPTERGAGGFGSTGK